ncbi:unnamed protein product, partial [marine sediment metagenome]
TVKEYKLFGINISNPIKIHTVATIIIRNIRRTLLL